MVTVSAPERPQGQQPDEDPGAGRPDADPGGTGRPWLDLPDKAPEASRAGRGVAARGHQTWASRYQSGIGESGAEAKSGVGPGAGWEVFSYLIAGMVTYGGLGWVIGHFTRIQILFPIGMLVGLAISLCWIVFKYGRQKR
jgi:ATP synthase protein I